MMSSRPHLSHDHIVARQGRQFVIMASRLRIPKISTIANCTIGASFLAGWWYRPIADETSDGSGPKRTQFMSKFSLADLADQPKPEFYKLASHIVLLSTTAIARTFLFYLGDCQIKNDDHYKNFLDRVVNRDRGTPLLTVSNHRSVIDDPAIMSAILPLELAVQAKYNRNAVCSQEYLFASKLPTILQAYGGLGRVLPLKRGGGVNQKLFLDYARLVAAGEWCHIYPEGGVWQTDQLGGRQNGREGEIGKLKWGVGKLVAHSPVPPHVVPFFFMGTESAYPQHPVTKVLSNRLPIPGCKTNIRFGAEVRFDDLIAEHEGKYGPLWKVKPSVLLEEKNPDGSEVDFHSYWDSRATDYILYAKITRRVEDALNRLNEEYHAEATVGRNRLD